MQLGYSQFPHSQPYAHSPFQWPTIPTLWQTKPNKQTKTTRKQETEAHSNILITSFNKKEQFQDMTASNIPPDGDFFYYFFFFLKKVQKTGYLEKNPWLFFCLFFSLTWELKWTGRGEKGGTTLQPIKESPNPFCPPPRNYYHFLPSQLGKRSLPNTSQKYIQVFSE